MNRRVRIARRLGVIGAAASVGVLAGSLWAGLHPVKFLEQIARVSARPVLGALFYADSSDVQQRTRTYFHGVEAPTGSADWNRLQSAVPGSRIALTASAALPPDAPPFVYENANAEYLVRFRERFRLADIVADAPSEYEALLRLGGWVGRQFDHGLDPVVGGDKACDPVGLVEAGRAGQRYWCEIAARTMVHAATAVGIPARIITASRDGYTWEHAVAEVWSNEFAKWFVIDTDFNHVYEHAGRPLSALELMEHGRHWQRAGELVVRRIAPDKPNIPRGGNTIDLYRYIHVDLRNDWCTRPLRRGSPAGGDAATWWTATDDFPRLLTAKVRQPDPKLFDWPVNVVGVLPMEAAPTAGGVAVRVGLRAYSPDFENFETRVPPGQWTAAAEPQATLMLAGRTATLEARVRTRSGWTGPATRVEISIEPDTPHSAQASARTPS
jgi:hypothetical protein